MLFGVIIIRDKTDVEMTWILCRPYSV